MKQPSSMASFSASATKGYAIDLDETAARMGAAMMLDDLILAGDISAHTCQTVAAALYPDPTVRQAGSHMIRHKMM